MHPILSRRTTSIVHCGFNARVGDPHIQVLWFWGSWRQLDQVKRCQFHILYPGKYFELRIHERSIEHAARAFPRHPYEREPKDTKGPGQNNAI